VNRLAGETSPYLRQHRDNPVDWYPWGPEAFAAAAERDVPILLSVGYSSCHWCHVMAHESFEDPTVAAAMNAAFVNVKVDREERPDVDSIYMDAVQAMTKRGGWPMTAFLTAAGEPFYGGTYFPRPTFLQLIAEVSKAWRERRDELVRNVAPLRRALAASASIQPGPGLPSESLIAATADGLAKGVDREWGGFGSAPKFPSTMMLDLVLTEHRHRRRHGRDAPELAEAVTVSLDAMASGGIHDHVGGGFARYSVDREWLVPHFEKMLYDQALLLRVYARAAVELGQRRWRHVATGIVGYVRRDLRLPGGAFASAEDADSPGADGRNHEGLFHTWTPDEVRAAVGDRDAADAASAYYAITEEGNFEGRSIPNRVAHRADWVPPPAIAAARQRLFAAREDRARPGIDDKVVTEWNALVIGALAEAGALLGEPSWIDDAAGAARFLLDELRDDDRRWFRSWHADGEPRARHPAVAADHAALLDAFTRLGEATGEALWTYEAMDMADTLLDHFWDADRGGVFTTPDDGESLIVRQKDIFDNALPSSNSTAAVGLLRLAALTGEARYANHADRILALLGPLVPRGASAFANSLEALALRTRGVTEVAVVGDRPDLVAIVREQWRPETVLAWGEPYDSPLWTDRTEGLAYVCHRYACQAPQGTEEGLRAQLDSPG
jgi:uncharacterized protein